MIPEACPANPDPSPAMPPGIVPPPGRRQMMLEGLRGQNEPADFEGRKGFWVQPDCCFIEAVDASTAILEYRRNFESNRVGCSHNLFCADVPRERERAERDALTVLRIDPLVDGEVETQFVLTVSGQCVGRVGVRHRNRHAACVRQLFVREDMRGRGYGRRLVEECAAAARESQCKAICLSLAAVNMQGFMFYERLGFIFAYQFEDGDFLLSRPLVHLSGAEEGALLSGTRPTVLRPLPRG